MDAALGIREGELRQLTVPNWRGDVIGAAGQGISTTTKRICKSHTNPDYMHMTRYHLKPSYVSMLTCV